MNCYCVISKTSSRRDVKTHLKGLLKKDQKSCINPIRTGSVFVVFGALS